MTGQETPVGRQRAASGHSYLQSPRNIGLTTLRNDQGRANQINFFLIVHRTGDVDPRSIMPRINLLRVDKSR